MKFLNHYCEAAQTKAMDAAGAFFAFNKEQFSQGNPNGVRVVHLGAGLYCPTANADSLYEAIVNARREGIAQDIAENGLEKCIMRELGNHEYGITHDITDTMEALADYPGVSAELVARLATSVEWPA